LANLEIHRSALFYGGYGVILIPALGIADAYGGYTPEYHNALGFFVLCMFHLSLLPLVLYLTFPLLVWAVFNLFFLLASCAL
jgi:hypothetical protein